MSIVKEYYLNISDMRAMGVKDIKTTPFCILRHSDGAELTLPRLADLFQAAAADYPALKPGNVTVCKDHIEFAAAPKSGYRQLPAQKVALQG